MRQARILIAEDDSTAARLLELYLRKLGYEVVAIAASADEAIAQARACRPDIAILDIVLEGRHDGIDVARVIGTDLQIPTLFLTAYDQPELFERARLTTPHAYLTKPFNERELKLTIELTLQRDRLEQRLRTSQALLAGAEEVAEVGGWRWDLAQDRVEASAGLLHLFGIESRHFKGRIENLLDRILPDDQAAVSAAFANLYSGKPIAQLDMRVCLTGGEVRTLRLRIEPRPGPAGQTGTALGSARDVTEELRAQSTARFRLALDSTADAIFLIDRVRMRFVDVNATACKALGYTREELLEMGPHDIKPLYHKAMLADHFDRLLASDNDSGIIETLHKRKDDSTFPVEVRLRRFDAEGVPMLIAIARDMSERQQAESDLQEANARFSQLAENVAEVFWIRDLEQDAIIYVNHAYEALFGKSVESLLRLPRSFLSAVHPEDRGRLTMLYTAHSLARDAHLDLEYRILHPSGGIRWIWERTFPIHNEQGQVYRVAGIAQDITLRKTADEQYRSMIQASMDGFAVIDPEARMLDMNESFIQMMGYDRNELLRMSVYDLEARESPEETASHIQQIIAAGPDRFETRLRTKSGEVIDAEVSAYLADNPSTRLYAFVRNISKRKLQEQALRESEERFRLLFDSAPIGIALVGTDYRLLQVNTAFCEMVGYRAEELSRLTFLDITHPDDRDIDLGLAKQLFAGEIPCYTLAKRYLKKSGQPVWINLTAAMIRDHSGQPKFGLGMIEDISERVAAEEARLAHEARQREALVREVHHRIKNNLQGVVGLLRQQINQAPQLQAPLEAAISQINTIAVIHGMEGRRAQSAILLDELVGQIVGVAAQLTLAGQAPIIDSQIDGPVHLDPRTAVALALVLNELIHNAIKHSDPTSVQPVRVDMAGDASEITLRISNPAGPRPDEAATGLAKNTGMGLDLVQALMPTRGARLDLDFVGSEVIASLVLTSPVLSKLPA